MRKLMLFTALTLVATAAQAQTSYQNDAKPDVKPNYAPPPQAIKDQQIKSEPSKNGKPGRVVLGGFLGRMDANHDGTVTHEEAMSSIAITFKQADTNHDGSLSSDEIRSWNNQRNAIAAPRETGK